MAWTTPRSWTTGEVVTASHMNTHVRDNTAYLKDSPLFDGSPSVANSMTWIGDSGELAASVVANGDGSLELRDSGGTQRFRLRFVQADALLRVQSALRVDDDIEAGEIIDALGPSGEKFRLRSLTNGDGVLDLLDSAGATVFRTRWEPADLRVRIQAGLRVDNSITSGADAVPVQAHGSYTGDGTADRTISLPFTPESVFVHAQDLTNDVVGGFTLSTTRGLHVNSNTDDIQNATVFRIVSGGFQVSGGVLNTDTEVFNYTALKAS